MFGITRLIGGKKFEFWGFADTKRGAKLLAAKLRKYNDILVRVTPITGKKSYEYRVGHRYVIWIKD